MHVTPTRAIAKGTQDKMFTHEGSLVFNFVKLQMLLGFKPYN